MTSVPTEGDQMPATPLSNSRRLRVSLLAWALVVGCGGAGSSGAPASDTLASGASVSDVPVPEVSSSETSLIPAAVDPDKPFTPVDLTVVLDADRAVEKVVPITGGVVTTTGADGTVYTLEIPADALPAETTIGLTPVVTADGLPPGADGPRRATYAVQMSPDGLSLLNFATLTIVPAAPIAPNEQVAFGYRGDGKDVIAAAVVVDSPEIKIRVLHFSGAGVTTGGTGDVDSAFIALGSDAERRFESTINELIQEERERVLRNEAGEESLVEQIGEVLDQYEADVVKARVRAASDSCDAGKAAVQTVLTLQRNRQILGLASKDSSTADVADVLNKAVRACVLEEFSACVEHHRFFLMLNVYFSVLRQHAIFPVLTPGTLAEARDLTVQCLTFKLKLESTATLNQAGWTHESSVTAEVILRFNPEELLINGAATYENTKYESHMPECSVVTTSGGGTIAILGILFEVEAGKPDANGGYPDAGVSAYDLRYSVGNSGETVAITCPYTGAVPVGPYPVWSLCYYDARVDQIDTGSGLRETDWNVYPPGDELLADKAWDKVGVEDPSCKEKGSFELRHAPGA